MRWQRTLRVLPGLCGSFVLSSALTSFARVSSPPPGTNTTVTTKTAAAVTVRPEQAILQALASNPVTGPSRFSVAYRNGKYVLMGRVGTKQIHDAAVQTLVALGYPFVDQLVID